MSGRSGVLDQTVPFGLIVLSISGFQLGAAIAKPIFAIVGAQGASALRLGIAAVILLVVVRPWRTEIPRRMRAPLVAFGVALAGLNLFFFMAIRTIPLGLTVAIEFLGPLSLVLLNSRRWLDFLWAGLAVAGILLLLPWPGSTADLDPVGLGFALLSATCWVGYIVFGQKAALAMPGAVATALGVSIAALAVVPLGIGYAGTALLRWDVWPVGVAVAIISGSLPYFFEMTAMGRVPTRVFGILTSLEPAFGALFGFLLLDQKLTAAQDFAIVAVMSASLGSTLTHKPDPTVAVLPDHHAV